MGTTYSVKYQTQDGSDYKNEIDSILLVFNAPILANNIAKILWIWTINNKIIELKDYLNKNSTNIPSRDEFISWAIDIKNNVINWVDSTKEKIDSIRITLSWAESKYNNIKKWYDNVQEFVKTNSWTIDDMKNVIEKVTNK